MPSTTVHIPDKLLAKIDQIVKEKEISRNRFIIQACEQAVNSTAVQWPEGFFESDLNEEDLILLREIVHLALQEILQYCKSYQIQLR